MDEFKREHYEDTYEPVVAPCIFPDASSDETEIKIQYRIQEIRDGFIITVCNPSPEMKVLFTKDQIAMCVELLHKSGYNPQDILGKTVIVKFA